MDGQLFVRCSRQLQHAVNAEAKARDFNSGADFVRSTMRELVKHRLGTATPEAVDSAQLAMDLPTPRPPKGRERPRGVPDGAKTKQPRRKAAATAKPTRKRAAVKQKAAKKPRGSWRKKK